MSIPVASSTKRSFAAVLVMAAILLAACTSAAAPSQSPVGRIPAPTIGSDVSSPAPSATPAPSVKPFPSPTPAPAVWSKPRLIVAGGCMSLRGGIDAAGGEHLVADCFGGLLYASAKADGKWTSHNFPVAEDRLDQDPMLGFEGNVAFFAWSRLAVEEGGCGDDGLKDIGVFYRTRTLPSGAWSEPSQIGRADDQLRGFRVDGSTLHAIVQMNGDGPYAYIVVKGGAGSRFALPNVTGGVSLRVGSDGRARIAYESNASIKLATFTGSGFSVETVPGKAMHDPVLVLDANDNAHVMYLRTSIYSGGMGCIDNGELDPNRGLFYTTNAGGSWKSDRMTRNLGAASFELDRATGQIHAVITSDGTLTYFTKASGGTWQSRKLVGKDAMDAVIARDATSGRIVILYDSMSETKPGIYRIAKG